MIALAKEGRNETATKLDRLPYEKKIATLLATVRWLEFSATDDALFRACRGLARLGAGVVQFM
ncbi:hypothetical protein [Arthrobacter sp. Br18]|uniref:hypothetical protein n=1 Tax=Arthrobacter sp. Br18 TaxID=1312954 RepID=UPI00047E6D36|nr:hypothetical protein [Arthrobacter sp. Br18]